MNKWLKIIIGILLAAAVVLGLARNKGEEKFESYFQKVTKPRVQTTTATFLATGDIMLSRNVAGSIAKANDPLLPFRSLDTLLRSTDFNFGNLESPLSGRNDFNPSGSLVFNTPPAYAQGLKDYNFQIINLANNHGLDQGETGVNYTLQFLDKLGLQHVGMGQTLAEAWQGEVVETNGIKIGFVGASYSSLNDGGQATNNYIARIEDTARLRSSIASLKQRADFVVVTMHAGTEYVRTPNEGQTAFAHAAIDAGADMVIGAHPHWVQTTEQYKGKYIFYSLGNFIFDQMWSQDTREGLTLKIAVEKVDDQTRLKQIELIPVMIDNYCCPRLANPTEAQSILKKISVTNSIITPQVLEP